jgi:hypothetical protein
MGVHEETGTGPDWPHEMQGYYLLGLNLLLEVLVDGLRVWF